MSRIESKAIPSLIQGVSTQSAAQRRDSQCETQFDCINSPKDGVTARPGADYLFKHDTDLTGAFCYELFRGLDEHYLVTIKAGTCRIYDLETGALCSLTGSAGSYLTTVAQARESFVGQQVDDRLFLANKETPVALLATTVPARPKEALVFFKAGAYLQKYTIAIIWAGNAYRWTYTTPDNSVAANAAYIATNQIAATFYRKMTGVIPGSSLYGVGSVHPGSTTGIVSDGPAIATIADIGFNVEINGNLLRIWRNDGVDFKIDSGDGTGDTFMLAIKDNVRSFSELPKGGFTDFTVRVRGKSATDNASDYWVAYQGQTAQGYWQEVAAPGTKTDLDPATMPHAIINTGPGTFTIGPIVWSKRIAGDGVDSAKDPGFVGKAITDLYWHKGRLGVLTEATADWSKARNPYTFFPDTVQAILSDAPIGLGIAASSTVALLRKAVQADEGLYLWAQGAQFRIHSNSDPFKADTAEADEGTAYEFSPQANFAKVGSGIYFGTEADEWVTIRNLQFQGGKGIGDVDVTDHVPDYIKAPLRRLSQSDTGRMITAQSDSAPSHLYAYSYLVQDRSVIQSAWNTWRFPEGTIIWHSISRMNLFVLLDRGGKAVFLKVPLRTSFTDPGGEYLTRLDMRIPESACTLDYNAGTGLTTITLPYNVSAEEFANLRVVLRTTAGPGVGLAFFRGRLFPAIRTGANTLTVAADLTSKEFYVGFRVDSRRVESTFYIRSPRGPLPTDSLTIREFIVRHDKSAAYRVEVDIGAGRTKVASLEPILLGQANVALGNAPGLVKGEVSVGIDQEAEDTVITLINDTPFPCRWQTAEYRYQAVLRAVPSRVRPDE